eukprot:6238599-Lingulodinium_polyedra.AAC.1
MALQIRQQTAGRPAPTVYQTMTRGLPAASTKAAGEMRPSMGTRSSSAMSRAALRPTTGAPC